MLDALQLLQNSKRATIMRITPRLGPSSDNVNDIMVNIDYQGQMIFELFIKLDKGRIHFL